MSRKRTFAPRECAHCGQTFQPKYDEQSFCGRPCSRAARRVEVPDEKVCECCGKTYTRRPNEKPGEYLASRFCSKRCNALTTMSRRVEGNRGITLCECGQRATHKVYFTQATGEGIILPGHLRVCADCYDFMLENDPGCTAAPQPADERSRLWTDDRSPYTPPHGGFANRRAYHD